MIMTEQSVDDILQEAAQAAEAAAPAKKERKPKAPVEGGEVRVKTPKEPKEKLYVQWNEDGSPMFDAEGKRVKLPTKMERPKKARGEGVARGRTTLPDGAKLTLTDKVNTFREGTKRHDNFKVITDGMTVAEYFEKAGPRGETATFLIWYIKEGYVALGEVIAE